MPWKESDLMQVREQFVLRALEAGSNIAQLSREFGISRKTGYKWLERYSESGWSGLRNQSRRPKSLPKSLSSEDVAEVVAVRHSHPRWGPRKIRSHLLLSLGASTPSTRSIARILERAGMVQLRRIRRMKAPMPKMPPKYSALAPNDVWTVDYKGWWISPTGERWEPLTIRDAFSRYVLAIDLLQSTSIAAARTVFERVFARYGLPKVIVSDNGTPFAARHGKMGLTALSAWWLALGIEHVRTRPATPSDNGAHERMHREMKADLAGASAIARRQGLQDAWDRWRYDFNEVRPHEAIGMRKPAQLYRPSSTPFVDKPIIQLYPENYDVRLVDKIGKIAIHGQKVFISHALREHHLGLEVRRRDQHAVWFGNKQLGWLDLEQDRRLFRPL